MPYIGTNMYLGNEFIGQTYLGQDRIEVSPFEVVPPGIVTANLVAYFDSTNAASYPGSGTSWYNLVAGQPITASLVNGVTFKDNYLQTNGTNQYIDIPVTNLDYRTTPSTVMGITRYADTTSNGRMMAAGSTAINWLLGHWSDSTENFYANDVIYGLPGGPNDTNWRVYAGVSNPSSDSYSFYVNGTLLAGPGSAGATGPYGMQIGRQANNSEYSSGSVAVVMFYNTTLTTAQIQQNYDALKSKVGL